MGEIGLQEDSYIRLVAEKATTLRERIDEPYRFAVPEADAGFRPACLAEWQAAVAPSNPALFENRLKNDGLSENDFGRLLGNTVFKSDAELPAWSGPLMKITEFLKSYNREDLVAETTGLFGIGKEREIPFLHLLTPLVLHAAGELERKAKGLRNILFTAEAEQHLYLQLAGKLAYYTTRTFFLEFQVFRSANRSALSRLFDAAAADDVAETVLYEKFTERMLAGGWRDFFAEYAALARILSILTENWIRNTADFLNRLSVDSDELAHHYSNGDSPGRVTAFKGGISDSHDGGKGVISITFESGLKLIYKPKDLALEQAWSELLNWLNDKELQPGLKPLDVICREGYGWVGYIEQAPCRSKDEVRDYYRRTGALIGIIYLLNGNDCHQENLIAAGAHPVLIDLESVMHHEGKAFSDELADSAHYLTALQFGRSVLRTGLLPTWIDVKNGRVFDVSGMGGYGSEESPYLKTTWTNVNTDRMEVTLTPGQMTRDRNTPVFDGQFQLPGLFSQEITSGFIHLYRLVMRYRLEMPLELFAGKELRFIFRATRVYGLIMRKLTDPKYLRNGTDRSIQLELLCRPFLAEPAPNPFWSVSRSEISQMEATDIPIFWGIANRTDLRDPSGEVCNDFMRYRVYDQVKAGLQELGEEDLQKQLKLIRASLFFREFSHDNNRISVNLSMTCPAETKSATLCELVSAALGIGRTLQDEALFSPDGSCSWMSAGIIPGTERYRLQPISMHLYDGFPGVALYLSALASLTGDPAAWNLFEATTRSIQLGLKLIQKHGPGSLSGSIGIANGIPSLAYALLRISSVSGDPSWIDESSRIIRLLDPVLIDGDRSYDIISGSAGCILALLRLFEVTGDSTTLETAIRCGDHLLATVEENPDGTCGWRTLQGRMHSGFSHGQAGIAYALLELERATRTDKYLDAAERAIRYENTLFGAAHQNWQDLREGKDDPEPDAQFMTSWCHGAPGIGLARLAGKPMYGGQAVDEDIVAALTTTRNLPLTSRDHLCCGNLGRADILHEAAQQLNDPALHEEALRIARAVSERAKGNGCYILFGDPGNDIFNPGFFQGFSGIGYALLRMAFPGRLPSILAFD